MATKYCSKHEIYYDYKEGAQNVIRFQILLEILLAVRYMEPYGLGRKYMME